MSTSLASRRCCRSCARAGRTDAGDQAQFHKSRSKLLGRVFIGLWVTAIALGLVAVVASLLAP